LDGIRNHLTADKRALHPFHAHANPIGDRHGVEFHGRSARGSDTLLNLCRKTPEMEIARPDLDPRVGAPDDGPRKILIRKADSLEHRPRGRPIRPIRDDTTPGFQIVRHESLLLLTQVIISYAVPLLQAAFTDDTRSSGVFLTELL